MSERRLRTRQAGLDRWPAAQWRLGLDDFRQGFGRCGAAAAGAGESKVRADGSLCRPAGPSPSGRPAPHAVAASPCCPVHSDGRGHPASARQRAQRLAGAAEPSPRGPHLVPGCGSRVVMCRLLRSTVGRRTSDSVVQGASAVRERGAAQASHAGMGGHWRAIGPRRTLGDEAAVSPAMPSPLAWTEVRSARSSEHLEAHRFPSAARCLVQLGVQWRQQRGEA